MPSKSKKQARFMKAACNSGKVRGSKITKRVACEFASADAARKTK